MIKLSNKNTEKERKEKTDEIRKRKKNTWEKKFQYTFKKCTGDKKAKPNALLISQQTERKLTT